MIPCTSQDYLCTKRLMGNFSEQDEKMVHLRRWSTAMPINGLGKLARNPGVSHCCKGIPVFESKQTHGEKNTQFLKFMGHFRIWCWLLLELVLHLLPFFTAKLKGCFLLSHPFWLFCDSCGYSFSLAILDSFGITQDALRKIRFSCHCCVMSSVKPRYFASFNSSRVKPWRFPHFQLLGVANVENSWGGEVVFFHVSMVHEQNRSW